MFRKLAGKIADKNLMKLGWEKTYENHMSDKKQWRAAYYQRYDNKYEYTMCLDIHSKAWGEYAISCYEKNANKEGFNNSVAMSNKELFYVMLKCYSFGSAKKNNPTWKNSIKSIYYEGRFSFPSEKKEGKDHA